MDRSRARFVAGAVSLAAMPVPGLPEVAFAGRSNAGKSSLINSMLNRRGLVRVSSTPGRTREVNFFDVDGRLMLADLPGYGYAKVSRDIKSRWSATLGDYLARREGLRGVVLVVDVRRGPEAEERQLLDLLDRRRIGAVIAYTKSDKLGRNAAMAALLRHRSDLRPGVPDLLYSSKSHVGRDELWAVIEGWL